MGDNVDSKEEEKSTKPDMKSGGQDSADSTDNLSENEAESDDDNAETTMAIPKPATEPAKDRRVSITLTSSGTSRSSKTFITDLKTVDLSMVRKIVKIQNIVNSLAHVPFNFVIYK